jgi:hypothetical protein
MGGGVVAEGHRQRDAARIAPIAGIAEIADIAVIGKPKPTTEALRHGERTRANDRNN